MSFDSYLLLVSIIVIASLTVFFAFLIWYIYTLSIRLIYVGYWDEDLVQEYKGKREDQFKQPNIVGRIIAIIICSILAVVILFSVILGITEKAKTTSIPMLKVVKSESMSKKYDKNDYLVTHDLNDQIQMFDIIVTNPAPAEEDIELYDVIVYEQDGNLIIHRVVFIVEPEDGSKYGRLFYTRGDALEINDSLPVEYSQIRGIYKGNRIRYVGSFVLFMQSPAGFICLLLAICSMIAMPIVDNLILNARIRRYRRIHSGFATMRRFYRRY